MDQVRDSQRLKFSVVFFAGGFDGPPTQFVVVESSEGAAVGQQVAAVVVQGHAVYLISKDR